MNLVALLAVTFALAFLAESIVEYVLGIPMDKFPKLTPFKWVLMYVGLAAGILFSFYWRIDLISAIGTLAGQELAVTPLGIILTGTIIGRGANFTHQFVSKYLPKPG